MPDADALQTNVETRLLAWSLLAKQASAARLGLQILTQTHPALDPDRNAQGACHRPRHATTLYTTPTRMHLANREYSLTERLALLTTLTKSTQECVIY
jgi:hypothetical protein